MKKILPVLLLLAAFGAARAQTPMRRLVSTSGNVTEWIPSKEKTGNLTNFFQSSRKLGVTLRSSGLAWADLSARGFLLSANGVNVPFQNLIGLPGTHDSGPHATRLGKPASQWTQAECYNFGRNVMPVFGLTGDQLGEGYSAEELAGFVATNSNTYRWIYEGMRDKAATLNPPGILIGSYETKFNADIAFQPGGGGWKPNSPENRNALASGSNARAGLWWFGLDVSHYVMPIFQFYPWTNGRNYLYKQAYGIQRLQKACEGWASPGVTLGTWFFVWPFISTGYVYPFEHPMTTGTFYQHSLPAFSFNSLLTMYLNAFILTGPKGGVYVWEDNFTYSDADPAKVEVDYGNVTKPADVWRTTSGAPRPTSSTRPTLPTRPLGVFNASILAGEYFGEMVAAGGETFQFTRFKIGNGAWIEPGTANTSVLEAAEQYRGWCLTAQNGNGFGVYYTNPYAPVTGETITVDLGSGKSVTFDCFGDEPVVLAGAHPGGAVTFPRAAAFQ